MPWSPDQYLKFEDERTRPARDLLAQVPLAQIASGYDLGCGPANSTALLTGRFGDVIVGIDSDDTMLDAARKRLPSTSFVKADLSGWMPDAPADLLFANAVFQWVPDHLSVLERLMDMLSPGGVLAIQMPDNLGEASHVAMAQTAAEGPWAGAFKGFAPRIPLPSPSVYIDRLQPKSARVDIWHTIYNHPMADAEAIVEWVKGTGLRPYLERAGEDHARTFLHAYTARIAAAYPPMANGQRLLRFPRLFLVAVKA